MSQRVRSMMACLLLGVVAPAQAASSDTDGLLMALDSPRAVVRRGAVRALVEARSRDSAAIPGLERALRREAQDLGVAELDWAAIEEVFLALSGIGEASLATLSRIVANPWCTQDAEAPEACGDADVHFRLRGFAAIGRLGRVGVPSLRAFLNDRDWWLRWAAASSLGGLGPEAGDASAALRVAGRDENEIVRETARWALSQVEGQQK